MFKPITIPKEAGEYVELLASKGYAINDVGVVQRLLEDGMMQVLDGIAQGAYREGQADELLEFLEKGEGVSYLIGANFRGHTKVEGLSSILDKSEDLTISLIFLHGLMTEGYYFLRHNVPDYQTDSDYRLIVDNLPHYPDFESEIPQVTWGIEDDEEIKIHKLQ